MSERPLRGHRRLGDRVLFYHSVIGTAVVGICEVVQEARREGPVDGATS